MRLINTKTLELHEFFSENVPPYAILSHAWGAEEVTFQDWQNRQLAASKQGFAKIKSACRQSLDQKIEWLWVDTNCIDKTSSAELTEAINSMFAYYQKSQVCFAYLADVSTSSQDTQLLRAQIRGSRWFTRGWTLQELIAPRNLVFYAADWSRIGRKDRSLADLITSLTNIDKMYLSGQRNINRASVSKRMSWLANRTTTRTEDMAYCMLGIFDINMPLLYGEGKRAFFRLQEEIIKGSNDHTIFCWEWNNDVPDDWGSLLAPWPTVFEGSSGFESLRIDEISVFSMTNAGLSIRLPTITTLGDAYNVASSWFIMLQVAPAGTARNNTDAACIRVSGRSAGNLLYVSRFPYPPQPMTMSRTLLGNFTTKSLIVRNRLANGRVLTTSRRLSEIYSNENTIKFIPVFYPPNLQDGWRFESLNQEHDLNTILLLGAVPVTINEQNFGVGGILATWKEEHQNRLKILLGRTVKQRSDYPLVKLSSAYSENTWHHWKQHVKAVTSAERESHSNSLGITAVIRDSIDVVRGSDSCFFLFLVKGESTRSSLSFLSAVGRGERGDDGDSSDAASDVAETGAFRFIGRR
ncbi:hypothetical protein FGADI_8429 [Fusarium gaditjirri]|uniref:Heterokaryon incompatibility domain-containing protein n=1 Tax=Fusarium gaditjirri TaxID=282569 RepID=A0A8H4WU54_9HYPO|nr:hypothetical protein FGADI_8429 [Fusarium gaditjirri]